MEADRGRPRRLIANLDAEETWARYLRPDLPRPPLSAAARRAITAAGLDMLALARPGDTLLLVGPLDHLEPSASRPEVELATCEGVEPGPDDLPWAATGPRLRHPVAPWWPSGIPTIDIAARVNHRVWGHELARRLGCAPPGARSVHRIEQLDDAWSELPETWVAKAALSAAGRNRHIHRRSADRQAARRQVETLLRVHGSVLIQPWLDRVDDLGVAAVVDARGHTRILGVHRLRVDARGRSPRVELDLATARPPIQTKDLEKVERTAADVGRALAADGYHGPFGVDACRHRVEGRIELQPLLEVNARMTLGHLGWAQGQRPH